MVASSRLTIDIKAVNRQKQQLDALELVVYRLADEATDYANERNLPQIKRYPPNEAVLPFEFATDKSRRFYFAVIVPRHGGRGRYQRTGGLQQSWTVERSRGKGVYRATLSSSKTWAQFVVGNLMKQRQVPGHRRTGWELIAPKRS